MESSLVRIKQGYIKFREKYAAGDTSVMQELSCHGQKPKIMIIGCSDSRVDPSLIFQCDPGELFMLRNVANIIPPYEKDAGYHGTSAALEYGVCYLNVEHLIILGHSQCGGIDALKNNESLHQNDFISKWVSIINDNQSHGSVDSLSKHAITQSHKNAMSFPWIKERIEKKQLALHRWFFDIKSAELSHYSSKDDCYIPII